MLPLVQTFQELEERVSTKSSSTIYFKGQYRTHRIVIGYDKQEKMYFLLGEAETHSSNKQTFLKHVKEKMSEFGFKEEPRNLVPAQPILDLSF